MKQTRTLFLSLCGMLLLALASCKPVPGEQQPDEPTEEIHYDTLSLVEGTWEAEIVHTNSAEGEVCACLYVYGENINKQLDSVPYGTYNNLMLRAVTQDTLLPLGTYTAQTDNMRCSLIKKSRAWGAETERWFKPQKPYDIKEAIVQIGQDSAQNYYLDALIRIETGENLYIRCSKIWRSYVDEQGETLLMLPYYPKENHTLGRNAAVPRRGQVFYGVDTNTTPRDIVCEGIVKYQY